eukprot:PhM_4_TR1300/c1_g2_i1/m.105344
MSSHFESIIKIWRIVCIPPCPGEDPIQHIRKFMVTLAFLLAIPVFIIVVLSAEERWAACNRTHERIIYALSYGPWVIPMTVCWLTSYRRSFVSDATFNVWTSFLTAASIFDTLLYPDFNHQVFILLVVLIAFSGHGNLPLSFTVSSLPFIINTYNQIAADNEDSLTHKWMQCKASSDDRVGNQVVAWLCITFIIMLHNHLHLLWQERLHAARSTEALVLEIANDLVVFDTEKAARHLKEKDPRANVDPNLCTILTQLVHDMSLYRPFLPGYLKADIHQSRTTAILNRNKHNDADTGVSFDDDDFDDVGTFSGECDGATRSPDVEDLMGEDEPNAHGPPPPWSLPINDATHKDSKDNSKAPTIVSSTTASNCNVIDLDGSESSSSAAVLNGGAVLTPATATPASSGPPHRRHVCLGAVSFAAYSFRTLGAQLDTVHSIADSTHATVHAVMGDTVHTSWNTARRVPHPEPEAVLFLMRVKAATGFPGAVCRGEGSFHFTGRHNIIPLVQATTCLRDLGALYRHFSVGLGWCVADDVTAQLASSVCISQLVAAVRVVDDRTSSSSSSLRVCEIVEAIGDERPEEWMYELARREHRAKLRTRCADVAAAVELCLDGRAEEALEVLARVRGDAGEVFDGGVVSSNTAVDTISRMALCLVSEERKSAIIELR